MPTFYRFSHDLSLFSYPPPVFWLTFLVPSHFFPCLPSLVLSKYSPFTANLLSPIPSPSYLVPSHSAHSLSLSPPYPIYISSSPPYHLLLTLLPSPAVFYTSLLCPTSVNLTSPLPSPYPANLFWSLPCLFPSTSPCSLSRPFWPAFPCPFHALSYCYSPVLLPIPIWTSFNLFSFISCP